MNFFLVNVQLLYYIPYAFLRENMLATDALDTDLECGI